jgi:branched-chain amino acid transport system substrate-binding protein
VGTARITVATRAIAAVLVLVGVAIGISASPSSAATDNAPIKIGFITDETGPGGLSSSASAQVIDGAAARIDAQNAVGGVDGHKLELITEDAQGTPGGNLLASQILASKDVFGVMEVDGDAFGGASYLNKLGIPVVGVAQDGPEWGEQPNTNMFAISEISATTPINGYYYTYNSTGAELKALGITRLAQVVFNVPSAINAATTIFQAAQSVGISKCLDALVPSDNSDFGPTVLQMKNLGCNGVEVLSVLSTCTGLAMDMRQADVKAKMLCSTGYDQNLLEQPQALAAMQGTYTTTAINVLSNVTHPVKLFLSRLNKFTPTWGGGIPSQEVGDAYIAADAMIKGLELAGRDPTRMAFISKMRQVSDYTAEGLLTTPVIFSHFGTLGMFPKESCTPLLEVKGKAYVPIDNGKPICGKLIRGAKA